MVNPRRTDVAARLARIEGHLHAIHRMVDQDRSYTDIVQQISAVRSSLDAVLHVIVDELVEDFVKGSGSKGATESTVRELRNVVARAL